jgi:predicted amidophosphoribosyltransferase
MSSESKAWYRSHGICPNCGQNDIQKGYTVCLECRFKQHEYNKTYRDSLTDEQLKELKHKKNETQKKQYQQRKAAGICVMCGKNNSGKYVRCGICRAKLARLKREKRYRAGTQMPIEVLRDGEHCSTCGRPAMPGKRVCERCYKNVLKMGEIGRSKINMSAHPWHKLNDELFRRRNNE